jgi:hypothetical protein
MKINRIKDSRIVIEARSRFYGNTPEAHLSDNRDILEFLQDHISLKQHYISLDIEREECCSFCNREWEEDEFGCPVCCDKAEQEWKRLRALVVIK